MVALPLMPPMNSSSVPPTIRWMTWGPIQLSGSTDRMPDPTAAGDLSSIGGRDGRAGGGSAAPASGPPAISRPSRLAMMPTIPPCFAIAPSADRRPVRPRVCCSEGVATPLSVSIHDARQWLLPPRELAIVPGNPAIRGQGVHRGVPVGRGPRGQPQADGGVDEGQPPRLGDAGAPQAGDRIVGGHRDRAPHDLLSEPADRGGAPRVVGPGPHRL